MKRSWFPILIIGGLLGLLTTLGALQFNWLEKISDDERDRMQKRLTTDTERFAEDFNREIQNAYFNFQIGSDIWSDKNWTEFNERYEFWRGKTAYPNLIKNFFYWKNEENPQLSVYDAEKREFVETDWSSELINLRSNIGIGKNIQPVRTENFALVMPVQEIRETINRIIIRRENQSTPKIRFLKNNGYLVIALDETVIKNQLFPELVNKYFPDREYNLAVSSENGQVIFQTQDVSASDATAKLLNLSPDNYIFYSNREAMTRLRAVDETKNIIVSKRLENKTFTAIERETFQAELPVANSNSINIRVPNRELPRTATIEKINVNDKGIWTLNVQHSAGSLENFVAGTLRKNLAISFGILSLLAISVVTIFISAQHAKMLAQKQIEFVSSVSHEFRTPLAVIYTASENLADGVAKEEAQVLRYGNLIKGEGIKLSKMVEQILEFAGAGSGKKKYDLREADVAEIVESALSECKPLLDERDFTIEKEIAGNLPKVVADKNALCQAFQNLIANSIKYSNGNAWLKISARNGGGKIKITIEDKGIGISAKDLRHIFEPFYRSKTVVDEQIHGNGLGLSLVKQIIEAHGGSVSAESESGKGSIFTITLNI